jgi:glycosyltransferase involved in cell wall biosynthesis
MAGIVALPRDPNPYQERLYAPMRRVGVKVRYGGALTRSHTLNVALLPLELVWLRTQGYGTVHLHWTFAYNLPGAQRHRTVRRLGRLWLTFTLRLAALAGHDIVWTAHNLLPHEPVFDDDGLMRRELLRVCSLVIAHDESSAAELQNRFGDARAISVIPHGPLASPAVLSVSPPDESDVRRLLFFGKVDAYKGVEELLAAIRDVPATLHLEIVGRCADPMLRRRIETVAAEMTDRVTLILAHVPESELPEVFSRAELLVFPFRRITTSGSLMLGLGAGRGAIVPDMPAMSTIPDGAVLRFSTGAGSLASVLRAATELDAEAVRSMGAAARRYATRISWEEIAETTLAAIAAASRRPLPRGVAAP